MSTWYDADKDGLSLDGDEMDVCFTSDFWGTVYVSVKIADIEELLATRKSVITNIPGCDFWYA